MKKILVIFLLYFTQVVQAQQQLNVEAFKRLNSTEERFNFFLPENMKKIDKNTFMALLPIIEAGKDKKVLF